MRIFLLSVVGLGLAACGTRPPKTRSPAPEDMGASVAANQADAGLADGEGPDGGGSIARLVVDGDFTPNLALQPGAIGMKVPTFYDDSDHFAFSIQTSPVLPWAAEHAYFIGASLSGRWSQLVFGQASQIISYTDSVLGEMNAAWPWTGTLGTGGEYTDWVGQSTFVLTDTFTTICGGNPPQQKPGILQEAGSVYSKHGNDCGPTVSPSLSPRLWEKVDTSARTYSTLTWPLTDEVDATDVLPRPGAILLFQEVKDLGGQTIQVTKIAFNISHARTVQQLIEWNVFDSAKLPVVIHGNPSGVNVQDPAPTATTPINAYSCPFSPPAPPGSADATSWVAFINPSWDRGLGLIGGLDNCRATYEDGTALTTGGGVYQIAQAYNTGYASEISHGISLRPGEAYFERYFMVSDWRVNIVNKAALLSPFAVQGLMRTESPARLNALCGTGADLHACSATETPAMYTLASPARFAQPLFKLRDNATGKPVISNNPYALSDHPYDGRTAYVAFLGWVPYRTDVFPDCYAWKKLRALVPDVAAFPTDGWQSENVQVLRDPGYTSGACSP